MGKASATCASHWLICVLFFIIAAIVTGTLGQNKTNNVTTGHGPNVTASNHTNKTGHHGGGHAELGFCEANKKQSHDCPVHDDELLWFFLSLFLIIAYGALVRTVLKMTKLSLPYTVVLMFTGIILGFGTHIPQDDVCSFWSKYTKMTRMAPKVILYTFLPALIFDSAYSMDVHVFMRSLSQILVLSLPGMVIAVFLTGFVCHGFMASYEWDYPIALMYGSIISATDPVAVVAILKELGTSEKLSMLIEGESLLNDGVAILMFEIFRKIVERQPGIILEVVLILIKISIGGPLFGYIVGKLCSMFLSRIFNDAVIEITFTLFSSYLAYWVGEELGISGVITVVVVGLKLRADSTSISPEVEKLVHRFWEMVGYLANTVLFVMVGVIVSETAIGQITGKDWYNLIFLYVLLNIIRLIMLLVLMPWMTRIGYGIGWRETAVSVWGGLRGAVGLCLSLEVYYNTELCELPGDQVGPKFLFHTAGIVFLTLCINGTTTKALLDALHLTDVSVGRLQDMNNAVKQIRSQQSRAVFQYRHDRFLADADWSVVEKYTKIQDPYKEQNVKQKMLKAPKSSPTLDFQETGAPEGNRLSLPVQEPPPDPDEDYDDDDGVSGTGDESTLTRSAANSDLAKLAGGSQAEISPSEFREQAEEARQRLLKALKVSFWRQYEQGVLSALAVQILIGVADRVGDMPLHMIHAKDFQRYFILHGFFHWFRKNFIQRFRLDMAPTVPPKPLAKWRQPFWKLATQEWFAALVTIIVLLNMIPAIWEFALEINHSPSKDDWKKVLGFLITNCVFTGIYVLEFIIKIIGFGVRGYFKDKWNWIDVLILIVGIIDICFTIAYVNSLVDANTNSASSAIAIIMRTFRLFKIIRSLRLLKCCMPRCNRFLDMKINYSIFLGYDIGKGFVTAIDDVIKFLPQMVENKTVLNRLERAVRVERLETIRLIGLLQQKHPLIAIAVKTRHASRAILNQTRETLNELKEDGLLDQSESACLMTIIEKNMKSLWSTPPTIEPNSPEAILGSMLWVHGAPQLAEVILNNATMLNFSEGDTICAVGDPPNGIYLIIKGMVKVHFLPTIPILEAQVTKGQLPNVETLGDLSFTYEDMDYVQVGYGIGEIGILTDLPCACNVTCETRVTIYHISQNTMKEAKKMFKDEEDSLESRLWRSVGIRVAAALLPAEPEYQSWTLDKIRLHVEQSAVPIGPKFENMAIPEFICDVILLQGKIQDATSKEIFTAPRPLPRTCKKLASVPNSPLPARFLVIAEEELEPMESGASEDDSDTSIQKSVHTSVSRVSKKNTMVPQVHSSTNLRKRPSRRNKAPEQDFA